MDATNIVYGLIGGDLILIPETRARELAHCFEALMTARTWGEFKQMLPLETYQKYLKLSCHYSGLDSAMGVDLQQYYPPNDTPFTPNDVFSVESPASQPGHPEVEMSIWVPVDIQQKYGRLSHYYAMDGNVPAGQVLELEVNRMPELIEAMQAKGFDCRRDDDLIKAAYGSDFDPDQYPEVDAD